MNPPDGSEPNRPPQSTPSPAPAISEPTGSRSPSALGTTQQRASGNKSAAPVEKSKPVGRSDDTSPVASALSALEGLLAAAFGAPGSHNPSDPRSPGMGHGPNDGGRSQGAQGANEGSDSNSQPSRRFGSLPLFGSGDERLLAACLDGRLGGNGRWATKAGRLECQDSGIQSAAVQELVEWLSYANEDSMVGFPVDRIVHALIDILAGRPSRKTKAERKRRRNRKRRGRDNSEGWVDVAPAVFGSEESEATSKGDSLPSMSMDHHVRWDHATSSTSSAALGDTSTPGCTLINSVEQRAAASDEDEFAEEEDDEDAGLGQGATCGCSHRQAEVGGLGYVDGMVNTEKQVNAADCLSMILDIVPQASRAIAGGDGIDVLCSLLQNIEYIDLAERVVLVLHQLSAEVPNKLLEKRGLKAMLEYVNFFPIPIQRTVINAACSLIGHVETISKFNELVADSVPNISELLLRDDEQIIQSVCQGFYRVVEFVSAEAHSSPEFAAQALEEMTSAGVVTNFLKSLKQLVQKRHSNGETAGNCKYSHEIIHVLSVFAFHSHTASEVLIEEGLFPLLVDLVGLHDYAGDDPLLMLRIIGLVAGVLPRVELNPEVKHGQKSLFRLSSRANIFQSRLQDVAYLCEKFTGALLRTLQRPTWSETLRLSLDFLLALTGLIRHVSTNALDGSAEQIEAVGLPRVFVEALDPAALAAFLYSILATSPAFLDLPDGEVTEKTSPLHDGRASLTASLSALLIAYNVLEFHPSRYAHLWERFGILDIVVRLSGIKAHPRYEENPSRQVELFELVEDELWPNIIATSQSAANPLLFFNVLGLIRWAACRVGAALLKSTAAESSVARSTPSSMEPTLKRIASQLSAVADLPCGPHSNKVARLALRSLREALFQVDGNGTNGVSPFEVFKSGLISAVNKFLCGNAFEADNESGLQQEAAKLCDCRLHLFVSEMTACHSIPQPGPESGAGVGCSRDCSESEGSVLASAGAESGSYGTGVLGEPLDLRPLLRLSKVCVGALDRLEALPVQLCTVTPEASPGPAGERNGSCTSCIPSHFRPDPNLSEQLLDTLRRVSDCGRRNARRYSSETGTSLVCAGAHRHLEHQVLCTPQALFGQLGREIKASIRIQVGSIVRCSISFPDGFHEVENLESSDAFYRWRLQRWKSLAPIQLGRGVEILGELVSMPIEDTKALESHFDGESSARGIPVNLMLQLSLDFRTTGSALEQQIKAMVDKILTQYHQSEQLRHALRAGEPSSAASTGAGGSSDQNTNSSDIVNASSSALPTERHDDSDPVGALSRYSSLKAPLVNGVYVTINGCVFPPRMTIAEMLCRGASVIAVARSSIQAARAAAVSPVASPGGMHATATVAASSCLDTDCATASVPLSASSGAPFETEGIWLAVPESRRFLVLSLAEERSLAVHVRKAEGCHATGCSVEGNSSPIRSDEGIQPADSLLQRHASEAQPFRVVPMWGMDHRFTVVVGGQPPCSDALDNLATAMESLEGFFISEAEPADGNDVLHMSPKVCSGLAGGSCSLPFLGKNLSVQPIPDGVCCDGPVATLPDNSRIISVGHILAYLSSKHLLQSFFLGQLPTIATLAQHWPETEGPVAGEQPLSQEAHESSVSSSAKCPEFATPTLERGIRACRHKCCSPTVTNPLGLLRRISQLVQIFDMSTTSSPVITSSTHSKFCHLSIYKSFVEDLGCNFEALIAAFPSNWSVDGTQSGVAFPLDAAVSACPTTAAINGTPKDSLTESSVRGNFRGILEYVRQQMRFLRGHDSARMRDTLWSAAMFAPRVESCHPITEGIEDEFEDESADEHAERDAGMLGLERNDREAAFMRSMGDDDDEDEDEELDGDDDVPEGTEEQVQKGESVLDSEKGVGQRPQPVSDTRYESFPEDVFLGCDEFAEAFQVVLLLSEVVLACVQSNRALAISAPMKFFSSATPSVAPSRTKEGAALHADGAPETCWDLNSALQVAAAPLFFPSVGHIRRSFASSHLTAKLARQLSDPITIASARLPRWTVCLVSAVPWLFPLDLRKTVLFSATLGTFRGLVHFKDRLRDVADEASRGAGNRILRGRSGSFDTETGKKERLESDGDADDLGLFDMVTEGAVVNPTMYSLAREIGLLVEEGKKGRRRLYELDQLLQPHKAKIRLARPQVLAGAVRALEFFHNNNINSSIPSLMEVEYFNEEGIGSGPTLEFYCEVLDKLTELNDPRLFREERSNGCLFPQPYATDCKLVHPSLLGRPEGKGEGRPEGRPASQSEASSRSPPLQPSQLGPVGSSRSSESAQAAERTAMAEPGRLGADPQKSEDAPSQMRRSIGGVFGIPLELALFSRFKLLGQLFAKALLDSRLVHIPLHPVFWRLVVTPVEFWRHCSTEAALAQVDRNLYRQLCRLRTLAAKGELLEDMGIYFILPGSSPAIELVPNGGSQRVSNDTLEKYIQAVCDWTICHGIGLQVWAFRFGIATLMPLSALSLFVASELTSAVIGGVSPTENEEYWTVPYLKNTISADHGFTSVSPPFVHLLECISEFDLRQRKLFLKFCTGAAVLPHGGFAALRPRMKVVRRETAAGTDGKPSTADDTLPSVMACSNYIKLPPYSSKAILKEKLLLALEEGQGAFTLS